MPSFSGPSNQQSNPSELFPIIESVVTTVCASGLDHYADMPPDIEAGEWILAIWTLGNGGGLEFAPFGWSDVYWRVSPISEGTLTIGAQLLYSDAYTYLQTTVDFVSNTAGPLVAQIFRIKFADINETDIVASATFNTFSPPDVTPAWGIYSNMWLTAVHSSMSGSLTSYPAGYSDLRSTISGTTSSDAQLHTCLLFDKATTEDSSSWIFDTPSGKWATSHIIFKGSYFGGA